MLHPVRQFLDAFRTSDVWWGGKDDAGDLARAESFLALLRWSRIGFMAAFLVFTGLVFIAPRYGPEWVREVAFYHLTFFLAAIVFLAQPLQRLILHFELKARPLRRELSWSLPALVLLFLMTAALTTETQLRGFLAGVIAVAVLLVTVLHFFLRIGPSVGVLRLAAVLVLVVPVARHALSSVHAGQTPETVLPPAERSWPFPEVATEPEGARVYLDWMLQGETPLRVEEMDRASMMVVVKEGYRARYRDIGSSRPYYFELVPESEGTLGARFGNTVLIRVVGDGGERLSPLLETALITRGLFPAPPDDGELERGLAHLGELDRGDFQAWARSRFRTDLLLVVRLPGARPAFDTVARILGGEPVPGPRAGSLQAMVVDLREGELLAHFTIAGNVSRPHDLATATARRLEDRLAKTYWR